MKIRQIIEKQLRNRRKLWFNTIGLLVAAASMWFAQHLTTMIGDEERRRVEIYADAILSIANSDPERDADVQFAQNIIKNNTTIPMVLTDSLHTFFDAVNFGAEADTCKAYILAEIEVLKQKGRFIAIQSALTPIQYVYYDESSILKSLKWVPHIQFALIAVFLAFAYRMYTAERKAEQDQIWIGLAKETAHQLGTPISGIIGWLENLKEYTEVEGLEDVGKEIRRDVTRLELVADRFSKIGAKPQLYNADVVASIERNFDYFKSRKARRVQLEYPTLKTTTPHIALISPMLIDWVFENIIKNALDALETGEGKVSASCFEDADWVFVDISDTGKGIALSEHNAIFEPGVTDKVRGWGLGLSLARRIMEEYHNGRIFVKKSELGKGTTFRIQFPKAKQVHKSIKNEIGASEENVNNSL